MIHQMGSDQLIIPIFGGMDVLLNVCSKKSHVNKSKQWKNTFQEIKKWATRSIKYIKCKVEQRSRLLETPPAVFLCQISDMHMSRVFGSRFLPSGNLNCFNAKNLNELFWEGVMKKYPIFLEGIIFCSTCGLVILMDFLVHVRRALYLAWFLRRKNGRPKISYGQNLRESHV